MDHIDRKHVANQAIVDRETSFPAWAGSTSGLHVHRSPICYRLLTIFAPPYWPYRVHMPAMVLKLPQEQRLYFVF